MNEFLEIYRQYVNSLCPELNIDSLLADNQDTNWEEPTTGEDFNNCAVIALIEAEKCEDIETRRFYVDTALDWLSKGSPSDYLSGCHLMLLYEILGEKERALNLAFNRSLNLLHLQEQEGGSAKGLIYLPSKLSMYNAKNLEILLLCRDRNYQSLCLCIFVLYKANLCFYNESGRRFLNLTRQVMPDSDAINLQMGIAKLMVGEIEGLYYLHHALTTLPHNLPVLQSLYLAYTQLGGDELAAHYLQQAREENANLPWTQLPKESSFTYVTYDGDILLAVDANFASIVTCVLLAEGDWFEQELEFWRNYLGEGMTVIDVGANAGVYTFSAAKRVGKNGKVIAIEPFSRCVQYLEETCRVNQFEAVKVCRGAASSTRGQLYLSLYQASELNEVTEDNSGLVEGSYETVDCFPLDDLIEKYGLNSVDLLKIDAEGHEIQVLQGAEKLIREFTPIILYENIASSKGSNLPVAEKLREWGYQLAIYQPFLRNLSLIDSLERLEGKLNVIAIPPNR